MANVATVPAQGQILVNIEDMSLLKDIKKAISMLKGVTTVKKQKTRPRLYDPETGEYLNDETMKVIEDALKGKGVTSYASADDMFRKLGINV